MVMPYFPMRLSLMIRKKYSIANLAFLAVRNIVVQAKQIAALFVHYERLKVVFAG